MYMAPIVKAPLRPPVGPVLRRAVGLPVLFVAVAIALPWFAMQGLVAVAGLGWRAAVQAVDYAGTVALGR